MERSVMEMIPEEITEFFKKDGGHSLIVKGEPGSGKTTFALEILHTFFEEYDVFYLSTRVADEILLNQFPWIKNMMKVKEPKKRGLKREELNKLEGLIEEGFIEEKVHFEGDEAILEVGSLLPELEKLYDFVESSEKGRVLMCVDSIDGLSEKYGIPAEKILFTLQKDLVESGAASIIFVLENSGFDGIEYLGDGVVELKHEPWELSWKRILYIKKLRGAPVKQSKYVYTLYGGRFNALKYIGKSLDSDRASRFDELKKFVKENFACDSLHLIFTKDTPPEIVHMIILSLIEMTEGGVFAVPPRIYPGSALRAHSNRYLSNKLVRIAGFSGEKGDVYLEGKDAYIELAQDILEYQLGSGDTLVILGTDTLIDVYGSSLSVYALVERIKRNHRVVLISPESQKEDVLGIGVEKKLCLSALEGIPIIKTQEEILAVITEGKNVRLVPMM